MNQGKRNIVFVGFQNSEIEKLEIVDIRNKKELWKDTDITHRFPRLVYVDTLKQARRHQGLILFLKIDEDNFNFVEYDIQNRKKFKHYEYVFLVLKDKSKTAYPYQVVNIAHIRNKYSKIAVINFYHLAYHSGINIALKYLYEQYLDHCNKTLTRIRTKNVEILKTYVKGKKHIDIKKASLELDVSKKWVERYLIDMNLIYHNIGYDEEKKQFYTTK